MFLLQSQTNVSLSRITSKMSVWRLTTEWRHGAWGLMKHKCWLCVCVWGQQKCGVCKCHCMCCRAPFLSVSLSMLLTHVRPRLWVSAAFRLRTVRRRHVSHRLLIRAQCFVVTCHHCSWKNGKFNYFTSMRPNNSQHLMKRHGFYVGDGVSTCVRACPFPPCVRLSWFHPLHLSAHHLRRCILCYLWS